MNPSLCWMVVLSATLWTAAQGYQIYLYENGHLVRNGQTVYLSNEDAPLTITCQYDILLKHTPPNLTLSTPEGVLLNPSLPTTIVTTGNKPELVYLVPRESRQGSFLYQCVDPANEFVEVTIIYGGTPPTTTQTAAPPTVTSPVSPSHSPPTSSGSNFTGLNPLIYTISAVILLGTLAIVAIITCWIRARRSFNNRSLRSAQTPQDYFDYLSDNEFTPLTTEEFQASLQERPPTYHQSEEIEAQTRDPQDEDTDPLTERPRPPDRPLSPVPVERPSIPPEEAAIMENLIALNLIPGMDSPRQQSTTSQPTRRIRLRAPAILRRNRQQERTPQQSPTESVQTSSQEQSVQSSSEEQTREQLSVREESPDPVEQLRVVGAQAQQLLEERRSVGTLVSLDDDRPTADSAAPTQAQINEIESTVEVFTSHMRGILERGKEMDRRFQDTQ